jgi:cellulose synthase/poly-beta-1,6-N-acetylglucosamine synthase-like glycosyltransferase
MSEPKVSFVVPTRNRVEWVGECLQSLLSQTIKEDVEVIVVDDASDDGTDELLGWFKNNHSVKVFRNITQQGAGASRNKGIELATAPLIGVCDDDDCYTIERAEKIVEFFKEHPEGVMMNTPYVRIGYCNEVLESFEGRPFDEEEFKKNGRVNYFCHPSAAYTKKDILEIGGYKDETKTLTDDYQLVQAWIKAGKKILLAPNDVLCLHRVLPESVMARHRGFKPEWGTK